MVSKDFDNWGKNYSGCDGGDLGSPDKPSTWVCGIEWGGHTAEMLEACMREDVSSPPSGYEEWKDNLAFIYNWQVMKLLSAINGGLTTDYKAYAESIQPFVQGRRGYFKMNLYPIAFRDTSHHRWHEKFSELTGLDEKQEYIVWCTENRFPCIRKWAEKSKPKLIVCLGKTYINDFKSAFLELDTEIDHEVIDERDLYWARNRDGTLVVILPFMVNRNGLVKNESIQKFGTRISELLSV